MKYILIVIGISIILFLGCKKEYNNLDHGVLIRGEITNNKTKSTKSGLTLDDADKIMVIYGQTFEVVDIDDESFSLYAPLGSATALIFVSEDLEYIGHLSVGGLNMLPLVNLSDGENTVIDLSELTLDGDRIYPSNDPVGEEILISDDFISLLQELGAYYNYLSANIDTNSDGEPDYFTNSHIMINTMFRVHAGGFGVNDTAAFLYNETNPDLQEMFIEYFFNIRGSEGVIPDNINIAFNGPEGNPHQNINVNNDNYYYFPDCDFNFQSTFDRSDGEPFETGVYNFSLDGTTFYKLHYYKIDVERFLVLARPRLITDDNGKVTNIIITYESVDNQIIEAPAFITWMRIELQRKCGGDCILIGEDQNDPITDYSNVIISDDININDVEIVTISYADIVSNEYNIRWSCPN